MVKPRAGLNLARCKSSLGMPGRQRVVPPGCRFPAGGCRPRPVEWRSLFRSLHPMEIVIRRHSMARHGISPWTTGVLIVAAPGCGSDNSNDPGPTCTTLGPISASSAATPVFAWAAACTVAHVTVVTISNSTPVWSVSTDPVDSISPPVTFGVAPPLASTGPGTGPPASGTPVRVIVDRLGPPAMKDSIDFLWP